jgi:REP element-mobilizing transposase RayT
MALAISNLMMLIQSEETGSVIDSDLRKTETEQNTPETSEQEIVFERLPQNPYDVSYTCMLLPKMASHHLLGDVAERLQAILKNISISYGWHLEFLSIKIDHLQWAIRVPPSTSTTNIIHVVRQQTSSQLFTEFPRFKMDNASDDFWAPGYLIFTGSHPHPVEVIQRYIRQTRKQQGIQVDE